MTAAAFSFPFRQLGNLPLQEHLVPAQLAGDARGQIRPLETFPDPGKFLALLLQRLLGLRQLGLLVGLEHAPALGVRTFPVWAFALEPVAARPAGVARAFALADDALESKFVAVVKQDLTIGKRLDLVEEGYTRIAAQPVEILLALDQRQSSQVDVVLME